MTVHFAAARTGVSSPVARILGRPAFLSAANDNRGGFGDDQLLRASLRHFAEHGLRAAEVARRSAEQAFFAGDRESYQWWFGICRMLDRRMALQFERAKSDNG